MVLISFVLPSVPDRMKHLLHVLEISLLIAVHVLHHMCPCVPTLNLGEIWKALINTYIFKT